MGAWWVVLAIIVGAWVLAYVLVTLFASWGKRPNELTCTDDVVVGSPQFLAALSALTGTAVDMGSPVDVLNNGNEIFASMFAAMRAATHHIHVMTFIWKDGKLSDQLLEILTAKAHEGVEVRVFLDSMGGILAPEDKFITLEAAGGHVAWFRKFEFGKLSRYHRRNHRRSIVIDGTVAYTGGVSIGDEWSGNAENPEHWRDMMVQTTGVMALRLQAAFVQMWTSATGEILVGDAYYPRRAEKGSVPFLSVASAPTDDIHPIRTLFWLSFMGATKRISIENPYFVPDHHIRAALRAKAREGVEVRVIVPNEHIDVPPVLWAGRYYYEEMLKDGVRIYEFQPTMVHSKFVVVDGAWSVVGSANIDVRSKELNEENVIAMLDTGLAKRLGDAFARDLRRAKEVTLTSWKKRSWWWRCKEAFAALFAEQF